MSNRPGQGPRKFRKKLINGPTPKLDFLEKDQQIVTQQQIIDKLKLENIALNQKIKDLQNCKSCQKFKQDLEKIELELKVETHRLEQEKKDYAANFQTLLEEGKQMVEIINMLDQKMLMVENFILEKVPNGDYVLN